MKIETIILGNNTYQVEIARTEEEKREGLQNRDTLDPSRGMLFIYDQPTTVSMWMRDTEIPLDIIYINEDQEVIDVKQGKPNDDTLLSVENTMYVVELNAGSGIKIGDELEFEEDSKYVMDILSPDGSSQMRLEGGERICSRRETKIIIRKAFKAKESQNERDFKSLGKYIFKVFDKQDNRKPEYVQAPEKKD